MNLVSLRTQTNHFKSGIVFHGKCKHEFHVKNSAEKVEDLHCSLKGLNQSSFSSICLSFIITMGSENVFQKLTGVDDDFFHLIEIKQCTCKPASFKLYFRLTILFCLSPQSVSCPAKRNRLPIINKINQCMNVTMYKLQNSKAELVSSKPIFTTQFFHFIYRNRLECFTF